MIYNIYCPKTNRIELLTDQIQDEHLNQLIYVEIKLRRWKREWDLKSYSKKDISYTKEDIPYTNIKFEVKEREFLTYLDDSKLEREEEDN
jgi:hypothetical protein